MLLPPRETFRSNLVAMAAFVSMISLCSTADVVPGEGSAGREGGGRASERAGLGTARKSAQERRLILFFQSATAIARRARAESSSQIVELWHRSKEPNLKYKASLATITLFNHKSSRHVLNELSKATTTMSLYVRKCCNAIAVFGRLGLKRIRARR